MPAKDAGAAPSGSGSGALEENAMELLLRSVRLDIGQIMELLDIGDRELRDYARSNPKIADLLERRRLGTLQPLAVEPRQCGSCGEWFLPYASDRYCSDACKRAHALKGAPRRRRKPAP